MAIDWDLFPIKKGNRGADRAERRATRTKPDSKEKSEKEKAKRRDGHKCCWPHETLAEKQQCRASHLESSHYKSKGMGGDHGLRSTMEWLVTFCQPVHQGPRLSLHAGTRRVVPLEPAKKMNGPRAFEEKRGGKWIEVGREVSPGVLMKRPSLRNEEATT
jgi:hypothetical protein